MASAEFASPAVSDALVILGAAGLVIPVFTRFRVTPIIGFILIGILVGPYGLGRLVFEHPWLNHITISDPEALEPFAEFGIILLLFTIGLELSFNRLWQMRKLVFGLGAMELLVIGSSLAIALSMMGPARWRWASRWRFRPPPSCCRLPARIHRSAGQRCRCCCSRTS